MKMKRILSAAAALMTAVAVTGCGRSGYRDFSFPEQGDSTLRPVSDIYINNDYTGIAPKKEKTTATVSSSDGLCVIDYKESYFDVTLDYEKGSFYDVGAAYAEAIKLIYEDYPSMCEGYIFENIRSAFGDLNGDYSGVKNRTEIFLAALSGDYRDELDGFADKMCGDAEGIAEDGVLSRDEAVLMQFVPDVLRGTACSVLSADGEVTASGERITCRVLEWDLGSDNQLCSGHALVHMKNGDKSFLSVTYLGFMTVLTAVNKNGLMLGELDVGSENMVEYSCENKKSYTYDMRYVLENCSSAREAAEYLKDNAESYPYCVNVLCTDKKDAVVAELVVTDEGESLVRDSFTPLNIGVEWDDPHYICAVNSFAAEGNPDMLSRLYGNTGRWNRYNELFCGQKDLTLDRFKELMTSESTDNNLERIRGDGMVHMVIADYSTNTLQAVLTGHEGVVDTPEFVDLGSWR